MMVSRAAHVLQRTGLAMAGAMAGTFVAAQLAKSRVATFDSIIFLAMMILVGVVGFYLGIDVPRSSMRIARRIDVAQLLSAGGIFLAALAALVSVYGIVFDEVPPTAWELVIGSCWIVGVAMLATAGLLGRLPAGEDRCDIDRSIRGSSPRRRGRRNGRSCCDGAPETIAAAVAAATARRWRGLCANLSRSCAPIDALPSLENSGRRPRAGEIQSSSRHRRRLRQPPAMPFLSRGARAQQRVAVAADPHDLQLSGRRADRPSGARFRRIHRQGRLGQTVVIENKAGASGSIGAAEVARAAPDGHTILCSISTTYVMNRAMMKNSRLRHGQGSDAGQRHPRRRAAAGRESEARHQNPRRVRRLRPRAAAR